MSCSGQAWFHGFATVDAVAGAADAISGSDGDGGDGDTTTDGGFAAAAVVVTAAAAATSDGDGGGESNVPLLCRDAQGLRGLTVNVVAQP